MKHGGNVNAPSYSRTTPLHLSAINSNFFQMNFDSLFLNLILKYVSISSENEKVMELLLNSGADPNFVDKNDKSPLFYAAMNRNSTKSDFTYINPF